MAVLTKSTEITVGEQKRLLEILSAKPKPSKQAYDRIAKAKQHPLYTNKNLSNWILRFLNLVSRE